MSSLVLMENAGAAAAEECLAMLTNGGAALVVSGKGMNGGDGFVVARHLAWWGAPVRVFVLARAKDLYGDALVNLEALEAAGLTAEELPDESRIARIAEEAASLRKAALTPVVVDAILGTGLTGEVRGVARAAIEAVNSLGLPVLALDCPSGLDTNEGLPLGECVRATRTVTFAAATVGFGRGRGAEFTGEVVVADIGLPAKAYGVEQ
jgi:NAD(P)H-hydrate epimerase